MAEKHLIYRQILEIEFPSRLEALDGQQFLSRLYRQELIPLIDEVFNNCLDSDEYLSINRLEIDLGEISTKNLAEDLKRKLQEKLLDELLLQMQKTFFHQRENGHKASSNDEQYPSNEPVLQSINRKRMDQFLFFIEKGRLPWWAAREKKVTPAKMAEYLLNEQPEEFRSLILNFLKSDVSRRRLIFQLPDSALLIIHDHVSSGAGIPKSILSYFKDLYHLQKEYRILPLGVANFRLFLWESVFSYRFKSTDDQPPQTTARKSEAKSNLTSTSKKSVPKSDLRSQNFLIYLIQIIEKRGFYRSAYKNSINQNQSPFQYVILQIQKGLKKSGLHNRPLGKALNSIEDLPHDEIENHRLSEEDSSNQALPDTERRKPRSSNTIANRNKSSTLHDDESIEISNAGLVVITPFLPRFFDVLELLNDKVFSMEESAEHAALILQYIATGETEMPEYELTLNKILCGLPIDTPLPGSLIISQNEQDEVQNLLTSAIEHWKALKGTSVNGLRQAFLNRPGLLTEESNGWSLYVERITADVLIDHLPWSISIIKLPWNTKPIYVEW